MAIKVKDLKEAIKDLPDDMEIYLQKDSEGNGYAPLYYIDPDTVVEEDDGETIVYDLSWTAEDACKEDDEWEEIKSRKKTLILAP